MKRCTGIVFDGLWVRVCARIVLFNCLVLVSGSVLGCRDVPTTTWSAETRSPDDKWLALARSERGGAYGGDYDITSITLKQIGGSQTPVEVLRFSQNYPTMYIKMDWVTPTHLNVTYGSHAQLGHRVSTLAGIEITVKDISDEMPNGPQTATH